MPEAPVTGADTAALNEIEAVVRTYLDGLYEGDVEKLASAFHPVSDLRHVDGGEVKVLTREAWLAGVASRPKPKDLGLERHDRILAMDLAGPEMAIVKLNCAIPPRFFTDALILLKTSEGWKVASKVFRVETR